MRPSPLAAAIVGAVATAGVVVDQVLIHRSNMSQKNLTFADVSRPEPDKLLLTSGLVYELSKAIGIDDVSPDSIARVTAELTTDLLNQSSERGAALDWASFRLHILDEPKFGTAKVTARVDVL